MCSARPDHIATMMRLILPLMFFALSWPVRAAAPEEPFVITGGLSPDKKLAVVVYGNVNWDSPDSDEPPKLESSAYLYNETTKKNIGPLEEIDVSGDGFGHTRDNLKAAWSPDGRFLAINSRAGRRKLRHDRLRNRPVQDGTRRPRRPAKDSRGRFRAARQNHLRQGQLELQRRRRNGPMGSARPNTASSPTAPIRRTGRQARYDQRHGRDRCRLQIRWQGLENRAVREGEGRLIFSGVD